MTSSSEIKTRQIASLINSLVEHVNPHASLETFSGVTNALFEPELTKSLSSPSILPSLSTIGQTLLRRHGERANDLFVGLCARDSEVARRVATMFLALTNGSIPQQASSNFRLTGTSPHSSGSRDIPMEHAERRLQQVKDFLVALQGVVGHYLKQDNVLAAGEMLILKNALQIGRVHMRIRAYAARLISESSAGLVCQRLGHALRDELDGFDRFLSILEDHAFRDGGASLAQVHSWTLGVSRRLDVIAQICESTESARGGALASALFAHSCTGNPAVSELATRLLAKAFRPIEEIARDFVQTGKLQMDSHGEFFITRTSKSRPRRQYANDGDGEEVYDYAEFTLNVAMIPTFIGMDLAKKILSTGCESKIARRLVPEEQPVSDEDEHQVEEESTLPDLWTFVNRVESNANKSILKSLYDDHHLSDHLWVLKQLLLLGQGDFGQVLVELTSPVLNKSLADVSRMELLSHLEHAVRFSNASLLPEDCLARVDVSLSDDENTSSSNAWDAFTLDYHVDFPLSMVISSVKYHKIFRFLFRLKRVAFMLDSTWKRHASTTRGGPPTRITTQEDELVHRCHLVRAEMVHFVTNLFSYVMFEVVETSWEQFMCDLKVVTTLQDLIQAQEQFVKSVSMKAMIVDEDGDDVLEQEEHVIGAVITRQQFKGASIAKSPIFSLRTRADGVTQKETKGLSLRLDSIFDLILRFCALQERLFSRIAEQRQLEALRRRTRMDRSRQRQWTGGFQDADDDDEDEHDDTEISKEFSEQVDNLSVRFLESLTGFLSSLDHSPSENLRFLGLRLDFNHFY